MATVRCYAPVIVLVIWAIAIGAGLADNHRLHVPWLLLFAVALYTHIREMAGRRRKR